MSSALLTVTLALALGQMPLGLPSSGALGQTSLGVPSSGAIGQTSMGTPSSGGPENDPLYPFDAYEPWVHGHFQEIPAYGGYHSFRPYNYKHVLSQSQVAAGWGMSPTMPYSHEYFRRFREQAAVGAPRGNANAAYAAEMARLRAQQDYQRSVVESAPRETWGVASPAGGSAPRQIDPVTYAPPRSSRLGELQAQIREQAQQLQALEGALQEEQARMAPQYPVQNSDYRSPARGR